MLRPSIFNDNLFDNFFEFPFFDDRAERNNLLPMLHTYKFYFWKEI